MDSSNKQKFKNIFTNLRLLFPGRFRSEEEAEHVFESYYQSLSDVPFERVVEMVSSHIRTQRHFPFLCDLTPYKVVTVKSFGAIEPAEQTAEVLSNMGGRIVSLHTHPVRVSRSDDEVDLAMNPIPAGDYTAVEVRVLIPAATANQP